MTPGPRDYAIRNRLFPIVWRVNLPVGISINRVLYVAGRLGWESGRNVFVEVGNRAKGHTRFIFRFRKPAVARQFLEEWHAIHLVLTRPPPFPPKRLSLPLNKEPAMTRSKILTERHCDNCAHGHKPGHMEPCCLCSGWNTKRGDTPAHYEPNAPTNKEPTMPDTPVSPPKKSFTLRLGDHFVTSDGYPARIVDVNYSPMPNAPACAVAIVHRDDAADYIRVYGYDGRRYRADGGAPADRLYDRPIEAKRYACLYPPVDESVPRTSYWYSTADRATLAAPNAGAKPVGLVEVTFADGVPTAATVLPLPPEGAWAC